jgi:hypothetical protein
MKHVIAGGILAALSVAAAAAEPVAVKPVPLSLEPAAAPSPARKYTLLPDLVGQTSGDAAEHYKKAKEAYKEALAKESLGAQQEMREKLSAWLDWPLKSFPADEARAFLREMEPALKEIDAAGRCPHCDFGHAERLRKDGFGAALPELQDLRDFAQVLAVRARLETAEGKFDRAVRTLQTGFVMARHADESPTLISALVAVALGQIMMSRVEELVQQPGAPNLYWALSDLPRPFVSLRAGMQGERLSAYGYFGLADAADDPDAGPLPPEKIPEYVNRLKEVIDIPFVNKEVLGVMILSRHETAKRALVAAGRPKEVVEKMPHVQVAILHALFQYDRELDEVVKWVDAPYWESRPGLQEALARQRKIERAPDAAALPFARYLLPAHQKVFASQARLERRIAALRAVEALRLYAAAHDGKAPAALAEIKDVPVPPDPVTGQPFDYTASGDKLTLSGAPFPDEKPNKANTLNYEITLRR